MDERLAGALDATWTRGREAQLRRVTLLERAIVALMAGALEDDERHLAIGEAHKLAGSLGSFGLDEGVHGGRREWCGAGFWIIG